MSRKRWQDNGNDTCIHGFTTTCDECEKDVNGHWIIPTQPEKVYPKCTNCNAMRLASVSGKCSDLSNFEYHGKEIEGYVPCNIGIGGSDYVALTYCLECGTIQGGFPISEEAVNGVFEDEEEQW